MPIPQGMMTRELIGRIRERLHDYNSKRSSSRYNRYYTRFMLTRSKALADQSIQDIVVNPDFARNLRQVLTDFGMDYRKSRLVDVQNIERSLQETAPLFEIVDESGVRLETISSRDMPNLSRAITDIFNSLSRPGTITVSGGFVGASKTMHFIMPEAFIILDGSHTALSLYHIADYRPHAQDGQSWRDALPSFIDRKPNPSPRGGGRYGWDSARYTAALLYYKRIALEYCEANQATIKDLVELDQQPSTVTRVIDKILW